VDGITQREVAERAGVDLDYEPDPLLADSLLRHRQGALDPVGDDREDRVGALDGRIPSSPSPCSGASLGAAM
jgi:hypothetical protein